jgi:hypothetical protein
MTSALVEAKNLPAAVGMADDDLVWDPDEEAMLNHARNLVEAWGEVIRIVDASEFAVEDGIAAVGDDWVMLSAAPVAPFRRDPEMRTRMHGIRTFYAPI